MKGGSAVSDPAGTQGQALQLRALEFLIHSQWLIGEAARRGIVTSQSEVHQQIDRETAGFGGGAAGLREFLKSTGESVRDIEWQARAELVQATLRRMATVTSVEVTRAQVAAYYARHRRRFVIPERREARFSNRKTRAAAEKLKREVESGKSLTSAAQRKVGELFTSARVPPGNAYERAIDSGKPHVVAGPFEIEADYFLYEVVRIIPARQQALPQVEDSIRRHLMAERRRRALASFVKTWTAGWIARTDCRVGYVVQGCKQYAGPESVDDLLDLK